MMRRLAIVAMCAGCCLLGDRADADSPSRIHFDTERLVTCRDVTTDELRRENPRIKLVEARFQVSALIPFGMDERDLAIFVAIQSPHPHVRVEDYAPRTTLSTPYAGELTVQTSTESNRNAGLTLSGTLDHLATASGSAGWNRTQNAQWQYELLPPQETVASSGTVRRGSGVYFKLRPAPDASLEGSREYTVVFRVPAAWTADLLLVDCQAFNQRQQIRGTERFLVAVVQSGNPEAWQAGMALVAAEQRLRRVAEEQRDSIQSNAYKNRLHRIAERLALAEPRIEEDWLEATLLSGDVTEVSGYDHLPRGVREAVQQYARQRRSLLALSMPDLAATTRTASDAAP